MTTDDTRSPHPDLHLAEIRALAQRFSPDEIEACIREQLDEGANVCEPSGRTEEIVGVLAKAEFVKVLVAKGATLPEAMRELGRRIRAVQQQGGAA
ncbi:MAG: hypothetical protein HY028_09230 [Gammaproteobacteria bacterium]|nr:hypothetical protein [Gammaproteobacteria bacterium]MCL5802040.1 hypothetical protein [Gammaproteobacteria bacterium]